MRQSHTYSRSKKGRTEVDPNKLIFYRYGIAARMQKRRRLTMYEAYQLAAIPAFFLWLFRRPIAFFKQKKVKRKLDKKLGKSNSGVEAGTLL